MKKPEDVLRDIAERAILDDRVYNPSDRDRESENKPWGYQAYGADRFVDVLNKAVDKFKDINSRNPTSFLDVGSGIGTTLFLTHHYFDFHTITGIEYSTELISICRWLIMCGGMIEGHRSRYVNYENKRIRCFIDLFHGFAEDFDNYDQYDLIFFFNISKRSSELKKEIQEQMSVGSIFIDARQKSKLLIKGESDVQYI